MMKSEFKALDFLVKRLPNMLLNKDDVTALRNEWNALLNKQNLLPDGEEVGHLDQFEKFLYAFDCLSETYFNLVASTYHAFDKMDAGTQHIHTQTHTNNFHNISTN